MATLAELVEAFRKETEDLITAQSRKIYKAKYGEEAIINGSTPIVFPLDSDTAYTSVDDYEIRIQEALDADGVDIRNAITITKGVTGFTVVSPRAGDIKWESFLKYPDFDFWT